jgi:pre-rRNA-processing protein TSR3
MQPFPPTLVWRHRRENLKKCSLRGLESRPDFRFFSYPNEILPDLTGYILLDLDAPPLIKEDAHRGLLILDATWRYAETMLRIVNVKPGLVRRSIPLHYRTAYPRRQDDCCDPERGLASIEAVYIAYHILGRDTHGLLDNYYWKEKFLQLNQLE